MTEKTTPELPHTLVEDGDGRVLSLKQDPASEGYYVKAEHPRVGGIAVRVDPAELMRNLAPFVPEVEPAVWLDNNADLWTLGRDGLLHAPETAPFPRAHVEKKWGPLTPLYAHPPVTTEPAQSWKPSGDAWTQVRDAILVDAEGEEVMERAVADEACNRVFEDLAAAGYVVTAEPAAAPGVTDASVDNSDATVSAPSVEQIAEVLKPLVSEYFNATSVAEGIHALYGTPGDAGDVIREAQGHIDALSTQVTQARRRAEKAGARAAEFEEQARDRQTLIDRVRELEAELAASQHNYRNMRDGRLNETQVENARLRAEVERYKAALEAAEAHAAAIEAHWMSCVERDEAASRANRAGETRVAKRNLAAAARAAVEAETSEEAGDE